MKPKILIAADVPGWALDRTAENVIKRLDSLYRFEKIFNADISQRLKYKDYDLFYLCYWRQLEDAGIDITVPASSVTGIRSHFKWDGGCSNPPPEEMICFLRKFIAINVPSLILFNIFMERHPAVFYTPHGVDEKIFYPAESRAVRSQGGELVVGWTGSRDNHPGKRGLDDYIMPAIRDLSGVSLKVAAREDKWRGQDEMVKFYHDIDVYLCASRTEGGPHPVLEAASSGVPVISTRVGIAPELIENMHNGILVERSVESIRNAIILLRDNPELRKNMGMNARAVVEDHWTWDKQVRHYISFFNYALGVAG